MMFSLGTEEYFPLVHSCTWSHIIVKSCSFAFKVGRLGSGLLFVDDLGRDTKLGMAEFRSFFIESDSKKPLAFQRTLNAPISSVSSWQCLPQDVGWMVAHRRCPLSRVQINIVETGCPQMMNHAASSLYLLFNHESGHQGFLWQGAKSPLVVRIPTEVAIHDSHEICNRLVHDEKSSGLFCDLVRFW
jgi:hypothetical protein